MSRIQYYWSKFFLLLHGKSVRNSEIDKDARINYGSNVVGSKIGRYSYCGYDCWIISAEIGNFCSISNGVKIGGPSHPVDWVSTSPVFHKGKNMFGRNFAENEFNPYMDTVIGNDVWIGENAIIRAGVTIETGAVIGTGSVVTHDVGAYEIWAGNPARKIRMRFDTDVAEKLLESRWWDCDEEKLKAMGEAITNPASFLKEKNDT